MMHSLMRHLLSSQKQRHLVEFTKHSWVTDWCGQTSIQSQIQSLGEHSGPCGLQWVHYLLLVNVRNCRKKFALWPVFFLSSCGVRPNHSTPMPQDIWGPHIPQLLKGAQLLPWQPWALPHERWGGGHDRVGLRKPPLGGGNRKQFRLVPGCGCTVRAEKRGGGRSAWKRPLDFVFPGWRGQGHDLPAYFTDTFENTNTGQSPAGLQQGEGVLLWLYGWHAHLWLYWNIHRAVVSIFLYTKLPSIKNYARETAYDSVAAISKNE